MNSREHEFIYVVLNFIFFRFYHFLQNYVDFTYIASFLLYTYTRIYEIDYKGSAFLYIVYSILLMLFTHFLYSVTYIINDYVNYSDDLSLKSIDLYKYSFYRHRPIQYFGKAVTGVLILLYAIYISIFWHIIDVISIYEMALIVTVFFFLSLCESLYKNSPTKKKVLFTSQLLAKYFTFTILLSRAFNIKSSIYEISITLACVLPYTIYRSFQDTLKNINFIFEYRGKKHLLYKNRAIVKICLLALATIAILLILLILRKSSLLFLLVIAHLIISVPFAALTIALPLLILGTTDKHVYDLYKRAGVKAMLSLFMYITISVLL